MTERGLNSCLLTLLPSEVCPCHLVPTHKSLIQEFCGRLLNHGLQIVPSGSIYIMEIGNYYKSELVYQNTTESYGLLTVPWQVHRKRGIFLIPSVFSVPIGSTNQLVAACHVRKEHWIGSQKPSISTCHLATFSPESYIFSEPLFSYL